MIIVTGAAGFIGSAIVWALNQDNVEDIVCVDRWTEAGTWKNVAKRQFYDAVPHTRLFEWLEQTSHPVSAVIHMGACSSTTESRFDFLIENNLHYSQKVFEYCAKQQIPLLYASSAATYGDGSSGYDDDHDGIDRLRPLNPYGLSKHLFDRWVLQQRDVPPFWAGFKFFNVFGPGELHKGHMMSLVAKAVPQIRSNGKVKLFKSYRPEIGHGEQRRDFVYVKDVVEVVRHFLNAATQRRADIQSGVYNVGTGKARSFAELVRATFDALGLPANIEWIDMPAEIRDQYQYFTQADVSRLRRLGKFEKPFMDLHDSVGDYVRHFLDTQDPYL